MGRRLMQWLTGEHLKDDLAAARAVAKHWMTRFDALERERDGLRKAAADSADALARATARTEAAEAARMAAVDEAARLRRELAVVKDGVGTAYEALRMHVESRRAP